MRRVSVRPILATAFAAVVCIAVSPRSDAAKVTPFERFVARAPSASDPAATASPIDIVIERWATDQERDDLLGALLQRGPDALLPALQKQRRRAGVVFYPGIIGAGARVRQRRSRVLLFAREIKTPQGRQVILAGEQYLAFGEPSQKWPSAYTFTLLDIRFGPDGKGVGKLAPPGKVVYNKETKIIELENYAAQPVRLTEVRSEKP